MADLAGLRSSDGAEGDPVVERVRALLDLAARYRLAQFSVEAGDFRLSLRLRPPQAEIPSTGDGATAATDGDQTPAAAPAHVISAPMIGTFYLAPAPDEPPFVNVGDAVEAGQTVAIIEAMKIMNEIQAEQPGIVDEVLARNGQGVEFGQPLFRLRPL
jgi:acetyl-CoA carboxylase biotin carboxyl carrier protein